MSDYDQPLSLENFTWNLFTELRKEMLSLQRIRAQIIGFKITFVSASVAFIAANSKSVPLVLFAVPAFASIFFDLLVHSYSFSIKRTGFYCREYLEPVLQEGPSCPKYTLWENFLYGKDAPKNISFWGQMGVTLLAVVAATRAIVVEFTWSISVPVLAALLGFLAYDIVALYKPLRAFTSSPQEPSRAQVKRSKADD